MLNVQFAYETTIDISFNFLHIDIGSSRRWRIKFPGSSIYLWYGRFAEVRAQQQSDLPEHERSQDNDGYAPEDLRDQRSNN